jgi:hypothetical protein
MHPIDRAMAFRYTRLPVRRKTFAAGWGEERLVALMDTGAGFPQPPPAAPQWGPARDEDGLTVDDATFESPAGDLPPRARPARARRITPATPDGRITVVVAAWNDHGYATRTRLARLLAERGITTVILENPFYGERRVHDDPPIRSVADFALMGRAAVEEAIALARHFSARHRVGITGYSMGGNIAALAGALSGDPVAIAPLAASHSPGPVWLDGILRGTIDWEALGGETQSGRLRRALGSASVLAVPAAPHTAGAVIVAGSRDGYIPREAVEHLHAHWPGSELRWVRAGHATLIWKRLPVLADAVADAFDRTFGAGR